MENINAIATDATTSSINNLSKSQLSDSISLNLNSASDMISTNDVVIGSDDGTNLVTSRKKISPTHQDLLMATLL